MTIIYQTEWNEKSVPDFITLMHPESVVVEYGILKLAGSYSNTNRPRIYVNNEILPLEYWTKATFIIPEQSYDSWLVIQEPLNEYDHKTLQIHVFKGQVYIEYHNRETDQILKTESQVFNVVPNQPFTVKTHIRRHETNGIIEVWINNNKVFDYIGITQWFNNINRAILADCYGDNTGSTFQVWQDSLTVATTEEDLQEEPVQAGFTLAALLLLLLLAALLIVRGENKG